jgi:hypothetical protein
MVDVVELYVEQLEMLEDDTQVPLTARNYPLMHAEQLEPE